ncbi:protein TIFY 5A-like [Cornus florida]|uniref:protein TIFY 5A-like n=1 Tax=Cornus florida TaxID=4283 RepID=UPI0028A11CE1|nr:protein TIFY 5A-like [Cornus florida]
MNCNLELRLLPPSAPSCSTDCNDDHHQSMREIFSASPKEKEMQQITIFYNGRVTSCDVTELQARAIIQHARREMEGELKTPTGSEPSSPLLQSQLHSPAGLSMKRSLQRFLQKRKCRSQAMSPYSR